MYISHTTVYVYGAITKIHRVTREEVIAVARAFVELEDFLLHDCDWFLVCYKWGMEARRCCCRVIVRVHVCMIMSRVKIIK